MLKTASAANASVIDLTGIKDVHRTPNGLTPNDITLENPYNTAPIPDILWRKAQDMLATMPEDQILVIVVSEAHNMPTTILSPQIGILSHLKAYQAEAPDDPARKFIFAYEQRYNLLEEGAEHAEINIPDALKGRLHECDPDGQMALRAVLANNDFSCSPQSIARMLDYALRHNIPTIFNDAGVDYGTINSADPVAMRIAREEFGIDLAKEEIDVHPLNGETRGMEIRNAVMVERALVYARKTGARIIVQDCGIAHGCGDESQQLPYKNSLIDLYNKAGCKTMGLFFSMESDDYTAENIIPDEALRANPDALIIRGAGEDDFYDDQTQEELDYIATLAEHYNGFTPCPYTHVPEKYDFDETKEMLQKFISAAALKLER